jgi:hypothetical protein
MSGNVFGCHTERKQCSWHLWVEAKAAAQYPTARSDRQPGCGWEPLLLIDLSGRFLLGRWQACWLQEWLQGGWMVDTRNTKPLPSHGSFTKVLSSSFIPSFQLLLYLLLGQPGVFICHWHLGLCSCVCLFGQKRCVKSSWDTGRVSPLGQTATECACWPWGPIGGMVLAVVEARLTLKKKYVAVPCFPWWHLTQALGTWPKRQLSGKCDYLVLAYCLILYRLITK